MVFVPATLPPDGQAVIDNIDEAVLAGSGDGSYELDGETSRQIHCNDLDAEHTAHMAMVSRPAQSAEVIAGANARSVDR